jgi:hypothetical protein
MRLIGRVPVGHERIVGAQAPVAHAPDGPERILDDQRLSGASHLGFGRAELLGGAREALGMREVLENSAGDKLGERLLAPNGPISPRQVGPSTRLSYLRGVSF